MRFYNVEMKGKFKLEKRSGLPAFNPDDEGRLMYYSDTLYYTDSTGLVAVSGSGGGGPVGDAALLDGQPGGYYLCADNITGTINADQLGGQAGSYYLCADNITGTINADQLGGQAGSYYLCSNNHTGTVLLTNGGTGSTSASGARTNLGLTGSSNTTHYHDSRYFTSSQSNSCYGRLVSLNTWTSTNRFNCACFYDNVCFCGGTGSEASIYSFPAVSTVHGMWGCSVSGIGLIGQSTSNVGTRGTSASFVGVYGISTTCHGVYGNSTSGISVGGNTNYNTPSSRNLKHLSNICLSNCVRETPLNVYKYYWEDSNYQGFNETIGPVAEDFNNTFNVDNFENGDEYPSLWTVDGAALGIGLENLKEIDKLKDIVTKLYSCIQKLEG